MKYVFSAIAATALSVASTQAGTTPAPIGKGPAPAPIVSSDCPPMNYSYAEVGWLHTEVDIAGDPTNDSAYADVLFDIGNNIFLEATGTVGGGDFDQTDLSFGAGYYFPLSSRFHLTARAGVAYLDTDAQGDFSEVGYYLAPGFRAQIACNLELWGKAHYSDYQDDEGSWSIGGGLTYLVTQQIGITAGYAQSVDDEEDNWSTQLGIRFNF